MIRPQTPTGSCTIRLTTSARPVSTTPAGVLGRDVAVVPEHPDDVVDVVGVFRHFGNVAAEDAGRVVDTGRADMVSRVVHEPVGVCGLITPWNYPLLQARGRSRPAWPPATPSCSSRASSPRTPRSS